MRARVHFTCGLVLDLIVPAEIRFSAFMDIVNRVGTVRCLDFP